MLRGLSALALLLLLAGCDTMSQRREASALDWEEPNDGSASSVGTTTPPPTVPPPAAPISPSATSSPPATPLFLSPLPTETWVPLQRWSKLNSWVTLSRITPALTPCYTLRSTNGILSLRQGSLIAHWDGLDVRLGFAPQTIDGQPYVHALDLQKTIQPLLLGSPNLALNHNPVLVIDPGHGGENAGARSVTSNHYEKEFTLDWAFRLQRFMASNGWVVFMTRSNDVDLALSNRVAFAAGHKADLFLSLHFNSAAPNEAQAGLETYCLTPAGMPSSVTREFADELDVVFPNNAFDEQNLMLALRVHRALLQANGQHDRGVRRARFPGVLRGQDRPAILVEGGYLSNPSEARLIADPAYRQKLAEAVGRALLVTEQDHAANPNRQDIQRAETAQGLLRP